MKHLRKLPALLLGGAMVLSLAACGAQSGGTTPAPTGSTAAQAQTYTASAKGYGGDVVIMVGINADGSIEGITVTQQSETKGIGSNVVDNPEYLAQYSGLSAAEPLVLNEDVDARTSATVSSTAVINAVNAAIEAYNQIP